MGRPTIEQIRNIADFATTYHWEVSISGPGLSGLDSNDLNLRCTTTGLPNWAVEMLFAQIRGHKVPQPGTITYDPVTLSCVDTVDAKIGKWIDQWREKSWEVNTGVQKKVSESFVDITITRLDRQDGPSCKYQLKGCQCQTCDLGQLTPEGALLNVSFTVQPTYVNPAQ